MLFPGGKPTSLARSSFGEPLVGKNRRNASLFPVGWWRILNFRWCICMLRKDLKNRRNDV